MLIKIFTFFYFTLISNIIQLLLTEAYLKSYSLTVSDRCFTGDATDRSGPALKEYVENPQLNKSCGYVEIEKCVPDDKAKIMVNFMKNK